MNTVKVRIALIVASGGQWSAQGYYTAATDERQFDNVYCDDFPRGAEARYIITAEVPVPVVVDVPGELKSHPARSEP